MPHHDCRSFIQTWTRDVMRRATWLIAANFVHATKNTEIIRLLLCLVSAPLTLATKPMIDAEFSKFINILDKCRDDSSRSWGPIQMATQQQIKFWLEPCTQGIKLPFNPFDILLSPGDLVSYCCCTTQYDTINNTIIPLIKPPIHHGKKTVAN